MPKPAYGSYKLTYKMINNNLSKQELENRWHRLQQKMQDNGINACLICSDVNLYYLTGTIFSGYFYLATEGFPICFIKRETPTHADIDTVAIRKPEDIPAFLVQKSLPITGRVMLEGDQLTHNEYLRLQKLFPEDTQANATTMLRTLRMVKTPWEVAQLKHSAKVHAEVYHWAKGCYRPGISDLEFQLELERIIRQHGSIGIFRGFGSNMEIHMGSILVGENAENPSPYDFALGGAGMHPAAPIGGNGTILKEGTTVMVDMIGDYTAYVSDMTRTFSVGQLPEIAYKAHQVAIDIQNKLIEISKPGVACADLYNLSVEMAHTAGLSAHFMGTRFQAKFVGHGVGIELNELPVLTGRSKDLLEENMTIAIEPKFVLPQIGAVGVENTFVVTKTGLEKLTLFPEDIIDLTSST